MNKQPVSYLQIDPRWKSMDYSAKGEKTTIGASGCGPTCAAMLIETLTGKTFTPADACEWSLEHGYKACKQGTYYSYFAPQFKAFGLTCEQLNWSNLYGKPGDATHAEAFKRLKQGDYLIACMGKGTWTSGGHFVVVWWEDGKVRINDPASTKDVRVNGDLSTFKSQVKYYWAVEASAFNKNGTAVTPKKGTTLVVNGIWDTALTKRLQELFGTPVDGKVSNQWLAYKARNPGLTTGWDWKTKPNGKGSDLIRAMQMWCGMPSAKRDGEWGPATAKAIQTKLGTPADGLIDKPSAMVKALQKWANEQK